MHLKAPVKQQTLNNQVFKFFMGLEIYGKNYLLKNFTFKNLKMYLAPNCQQTRIVCYARAVSQGDAGTWQRLTASVVYFVLISKS